MMGYEDTLGANALIDNEHERSEGSFDHTVALLAEAIMAPNSEPHFGSQTDVTDFFRDHLVDYFPYHPDAGLTMSGNFGWTEERLPFTINNNKVKDIFTYKRVETQSGPGLLIETINLEKLKAAIRQYIPE